MNFASHRMAVIARSKGKANCCKSLFTSSQILYSSGDDEPIPVFDRKLKQTQKYWAYNRKGAEYYDYLREECAERICDRVDDITRSFPLALDLGCHRGHIYNIINSRENIRGEKGSFVEALCTWM